MKLRVFLASTAIATQLMGCSSSQTQQEQPNASELGIYQPEKCQWADHKPGAPAWTCNYVPPDDNFVAFGVGKARTSSYDATISRNKAIADAQAELQRQIETKVEKGIKEATLSTGAAGSDDETYDTATKQVLNALVKGTVNNSRKLKEVAGPDGYTYVLIGIARNGFDDLVSSSVKSSMNNQKAQYQVYVAEKIQEEFAEDFKNYQSR